MPHPLCTYTLECCTHVAESLYPLYIYIEWYPPSTSWVNVELDVLSSSVYVALIAEVCSNAITVHMALFAGPKLPEGDPVCIVLVIIDSLSYYSTLYDDDDVAVIAVEIALLGIGQYLQLS